MNRLNIGFTLYFFINNQIRINETAEYRADKLSGVKLNNFSHINEIIENPNSVVIWPKSPLVINLSNSSEELVNKYI